jgi:hypothetical protein
VHRVLLDLRLGLGVVAAIFGLAAAGLAFKASYQTRSEQDDFRRWYDAKWQAIRASPWHLLPEVTIRSLVEGRNSLATRDGFFALVMSAFLWSLPLLLGIPLWLRRTSIHAIVVKMTEYRLFSFEAVFITLLLLLLVLEGRLFWPIVLTASAAFSVVAVVAGKVWLDILTGVSINWAPVVALLLFPMFGVLFTSPLILLNKVTRFTVDSSIFFTPDPFATSDIERPNAFEANVLLFGLSVASSFAITLSALSNWPPIRSGGVGTAEPENAWVKCCLRRRDGCRLVVRVCALDSSTKSDGDPDRGDSECTVGTCLRYRVPMGESTVAIGNGLLVWKGGNRIPRIPLRKGGAAGD